MQSVSVEQLVLQLVAPHVYAPQFVVTGAGQLPPPVQFANAVATPAVQLAARHGVELDKYAHALTLTPSHAPLQLEPSPLHAARGAIGAPVTAVHVPTEPLTLHAWHCPLHALLQHTPSTHCPDKHCRACVQDWPFAAFATHAPVEQ